MEIAHQYPSTWVSNICKQAKQIQAQVPDKQPRDAVNSTGEQWNLDQDEHFDIL